MRVAIVGAGICGISAGRSLHQMGHEVVVFEKSRGVGGRIANRRQDGFVWDTGATSIAPRGRAIEKVMLEVLDTRDLVAIEKPIYAHHGLRPTRTEGRPKVPRYTYRTGNATLVKLLAQGLEIRTQAAVDEIQRDGDRFIVRDERFDAVILTPPVPQSSLLLWGLGERRPTANARYRACLSINLGYHVDLPETPYHALIDPEQRHPLNWLSLESVKSPDRAPTPGSAFSAQLGAAYSVEHYTSPDEELVATVAAFLSQLYGSEFRHPVASTVMRWKYSQPEGIASFDAVNPPGTRLIVAGDAMIGGRTEEAFDLGLRAANLLVGAPATVAGTPSA